MSAACPWGQPPGQPGRYAGEYKGMDWIHGPWVGEHTRHCFSSAMCCSFLMRNEFLVYFLVGTESKYLLTMQNMPVQRCLNLINNLHHSWGNYCNSFN